MNKRKLLGLCWVTYVLAYLTRVNFSATLNKIAEQTSLSLEVLGLIASAFFIFYAIGQLINGFISDKFDPSKIVILALIGTSFCNIMFASFSNPYIMLLFWALNGYVQSMFWSPLIRCLSNRFSKTEYVGVSTIMNYSITAGFILSWGVLSYLLIDYSWQLSFYLPSVMTMVLAVVWFFVRDRETVKIKKSRIGFRTIFDFTTVKEIIVREKIYIFIIACFLMGTIKESISLWAPTILTVGMGIEPTVVVTIISIIPLLNIFGVFGAKKIFDKTKNNIKKTTIILVMIGCTVSMIMALGVINNYLIEVVLLAIVSAVIYGCDSAILAYIPLSFAKYNVVSSLYGIMSFFLYMGATISSMFMGSLLANSDVNFIFILWAVTFACIGLVVLKSSINLSFED